METNRDHSVIFEIASKYCILDSVVDHDGYSISSKGFLPTIVDIMGEFNSDHYMYYCGQESLRRNGIAIMVNKRVRNAVLGCNLKNNIE